MGNQDEFMEWYNQIYRNAPALMSMKEIAYEAWLAGRQLERDRIRAFIDAVLQNAKQKVVG